LLRRATIVAVTLDAVPFVISYLTDDVGANRRFYGEFLGLQLHTEPGLEDAFFLAGREGVRLQILRGPAAFAEIGREPVVPSSGMLILGVDTAADLEELRQRASEYGVEELAERRADRAASFLDPDGRLVTVQLFHRVHRFHD
jgi:catechol 2,3-dioxygenase-like lactoylglutathione lyase family enzyme